MYDSIYIHQHPRPPDRTHKVCLKATQSTATQKHIPKTKSETVHRKHETQGRFNLRYFPHKHCFPTNVWIRK